MFIRIGIGSEVAKLASRSLPYNLYDAGWSSPVARRAHNPKVTGSNPVPATIGSPGLFGRDFLVFGHGGTKRCSELGK